MSAGGFNLAFTACQLLSCSGDDESVGTGTGRFARPTRDEHGEPVVAPRAVGAVVVEDRRDCRAAVAGGRVRAAAGVVPGVRERIQGRRTER